jgi:hypothetical protein
MSDPRRVRLPMSREQAAELWKRPSHVIHRHGVVVHTSKRGRRDDDRSHVSAGAAHETAKFVANCVREEATEHGFLGERAGKDRQKRDDIEGLLMPAQQKCQADEDRETGNDNARADADDPPACRHVHAAQQDQRRQAGECDCARDSSHATKAWPSKRKDDCLGDLGRSNDPADRKAYPEQAAR